MPNPIEIRKQNSESKAIALPSEWPINDIKIADAEVSRATHAIRLFYYRQIPLLRQIPYLALEANGRGGWLDEYSRAYEHCLMAIHREGEMFGTYPSGSYDMFIELRTGELIGAKGSSSSYVITPSAKTIEFGGDTTWNLASDREVFVKLAYQDENRRFNPAKEIASMKERTTCAYHNRPEEVARALKEKEQDKLHLDTMMAALPEEQVVGTLRAQGFDV